jgi:hypothetical protein
MSTAQAAESPTQTDESRSRGCIPTSPSGELATQVGESTAQGGISPTRVGESTTHVRVSTNQRGESTPQARVATIH